MKAKRILLTAASVIVLAVGAGAALAQDDDYDYYGRYDDQADETRRLNLLQLQNPGAGMAAVPPPGGSVGYDDDMAGPDLADDNDLVDDDGVGGPELSSPLDADDDLDDIDDSGMADDDDAGEPIDDDAELGADDDPGMGDDEPMSDDDGGPY